MASDRQSKSAPVNHPALGPAVEIYADRNQAWGNLFLDLAFFCVALLGFVLGYGDLTGGTASNLGGLTLPPILGLAEIFGAAIVAAWAMRAAWLAIRRIRSRAFLVVGRDGFEYLAGSGPVGWDEVESVSDPSSSDAHPRTLRVQLANPGDYARSHRLSPIGRVLFLLARGDLVLGHESMKPVPEVQGLMRMRLEEFRGTGEGAALSPAAMSRTSKRRPRRRNK